MDSSEYKKYEREDSLKALKTPSEELSLADKLLKTTLDKCKEQSK